MIQISKAVEEARKAVYPGGLSQYRTPFSRELEGKYFEVFYKDGTVMKMSFPGRSHISVDYEGNSFTTECQVQKAEDGAYFVLAETELAYRTGFMMVIDLFNNTVTAVIAEQGRTPSFPNLVSRVVKFGAMKDGEGNLAEITADYTRDLIGKKINWIYNPNFEVVHVYLDKNYYTTAGATEEMRQRREAMKKEHPEWFANRPDPYYESDCLYIKLRENLYLFSFVEKNSGSGTQGLMVINTDRITDVGCFWGSNRMNEREGYTFSAYGAWIKEEFPEDHTLEKAGLI